VTTFLDIVPWVAVALGALVIGLYLFWPRR
jgi:hypothetical protein